MEETINEASPKSIQSSMRMDTLKAPRLPAAHHPSTESLTLQLSAWVGVVGGWRGGFFFQAVFGVENGQSMSTWTMDFPCKFYLGGGWRIYFPFGQWEGPNVVEDEGGLHSV